jgi:hypothetical protein
MLCDDLIANGAPGSGCNISCLLPALRTAQKFTLSPECAAVAEALANDYSGLVRAFEHCRLPFPSTWIEVVHSDRPLFFNSRMQAPDYQVIPRRVGYLLTSTRDDLSAWKAHLFWSTDRGCGCPGLAMQFDMINECDNATTVMAIKDMPRLSSTIDWNNIDSHPGWTRAKESVQLAMVNHTRPLMPDYGFPVPTMDFPPHRIMEYCEAVMDLSRSDWAGEPAYLLAVIGLLNARNAVETETVDYSRLNKARTKRGKLPLFEHKVLKIAHRQIKRVYGEAGSRGDYTPMRGHFVRGHFKTRKTGIYFWHPHARGSFERGAIIKDYELT